MLIDVPTRDELNKRVLESERHIVADQSQLAELVTRRLAPLAGLRAGPRRLLTETLLAWLQLDKNATEVAVRLHVHPQTVRYRLRQLDALFGPALRDPAQRLELEVALLAERAVVTG